VAISGAGKTFSGDYYLTEVTHSVTPQDGYLTRFRGQRNAT
jgi:phage protein D